MLGLWATQQPQRGGTTSCASRPSAGIDRVKCWISLKAAGEQKTYYSLVGATIPATWPTGRGSGNRNVGPGRPRPVGLAWPGPPWSDIADRAACRADIPLRCTAHVHRRPTRKRPSRNQPDLPRVCWRIATVSCPLSSAAECSEDVTAMTSSLDSRARASATHIVLVGPSPSGSRRVSIARSMAECALAIVADCLAMSLLAMAIGARRTASFVRLRWSCIVIPLRLPLKRTYLCFKIALFKGRRGLVALLNKRHGLANSGVPSRKNIFAVPCRKRGCRAVVGVRDQHPLPRAGCLLCACSGRHLRRIKIFFFMRYVDCAAT